MIISKTPLRISFFGGGTDFPEYFNKTKTRVIGTAIDKSIYITNSFFSNEKKIKFKLFYREVEKVNKVNLIKHKVIRKLFQKIRIKNNLELHFISDLPSFSGLGSSSSFSTGLMNLIFFLNKKLINKNDLARFVIDFERNDLKECVGFQDQIFASYGGFNSISFEGRKFKVKKYSLNKDIQKIENNSFIVHTDLKRKAISIEKKKLNRINKNIKYLNSIKSISEEANKYLELEKLSKNFSYLLNETWKQKKKLHENVSNKLIENLYNKGLAHGATAGKLLGAGNGGFLYFYVPKKNQYNFLRYFKDAIKINFEEEGSKIINI
jgi:D-glycero-alpha-D-manno-heptose-7-phosphate kinase